MDEQNSSYGKTPMWQWILLYIVIGGVIYGLVYYFAFGGQGSYTAPAATSNNSAQTGVPTTGAAPTTGSAPAQTTAPAYTFP